MKNVFFCIALNLGAALLAWACTTAPVVESGEGVRLELAPGMIGTIDSETRLRLIRFDQRELLKPGPRTQYAEMEILSPKGRHEFTINAETGGSGLTQLGTADAEGFHVRLYRFNMNSLVGVVVTRSLTGSTP